MDDPIYEALGKAVDDWCGAESGSYGMAKPLSSLWGASKGTAIKYYPYGVRRLIKHVRSQDIFKDCERADEDELVTTKFRDNGSIKTFGDLYDHLEPCGDA